MVESLVSKEVGLCQLALKVKKASEAVKDECLRVDSKLNLP